MGTSQSSLAKASDNIKRDSPKKLSPSLACEDGKQKMEKIVSTESNADAVQVLAEALAAVSEDVDSDTASVNRTNDSSTDEEWDSEEEDDDGTCRRENGSCSLKRYRLIGDPVYWLRHYRRMGRTSPDPS